MTLFLHTELNGFGGQIISLALVSDCKGSDFYAVRALPESPTPWVAQNVLPVLGARPVSDRLLQKKLLDFFYRHTGEMVVAVWRHDIINFQRLLGEVLGNAHRLDLTMGLVTPPSSLESEVPHNALHEARALMRWYLATAL